MLVRFWVGTFQLGINNVMHCGLTATLVITKSGLKWDCYILPLELWAVCSILHICIYFVIDAALILADEQAKKPCRKFLQTGENASLSPFASKRYNVIPTQGGLNLMDQQGVIGSVVLFLSILRSVCIRYELQILSPDRGRYGKIKRTDRR